MIPNCLNKAVSNLTKTKHTQNSETKANTRAGIILIVIPVPWDVHLEIHPVLCFSKCGSQVSSLDIIKEFVGKAESQALPQNCWARICVLTKSSGTLYESEKVSEKFFWFGGLNFAYWVLLFWLFWAFVEALGLLSAAEKELRAQKLQ